MALLARVALRLNKIPFSDEMMNLTDLQLKWLNDAIDLSLGKIPATIADPHFEKEFKEFLGAK